jgi:flagellar hook assembly protein FlgD
MLALTEQIEFENLPPRHELSPVEDVTELERTLETLMQPLTATQRLEACHQLIGAAMRGEALHVLNQPTRIQIGDKNGTVTRAIKLSADSTVHAVLYALASVTSNRN